MIRIACETFTDDFPSAIPNWEVSHPFRAANDKALEWINKNLSPEDIVSITRGTVMQMSCVSVYYKIDK